MNDFTKEELEDLLNCWASAGDPPLIEKTMNGWGDEMADKIQAMIDNYCEHEIMTADMKEHHLPRNAEPGDTMGIPPYIAGWISK